MVCIFLLYTLCYENLIHHFPTCYAYSSLKKAYRELNLERALNEDTGPGDFSILSSSSPLGQTAVMYILYVTICILYAYDIHIIT